MALQLTFTSKSNVALTDAYHKVTDLRWRNKQSTGLRIQVSSYPAKADADEGKPAVEVRTFIVLGFDKNHATDSAHKQLYDWLKTQTDFTGATDV